MSAHLRRQLPVWSPLDLAALLSGVTAMLGRNGHAVIHDRDADAAEAPPDDSEPGGEAIAELRRRFSPRALVATDSGTSALALALRAAARLRSTPVALPAYCCYDVATAADGAGVPVLLYDLDPLTLGPNFASLERALARGARTVVVAHLYGVPVDLERVARLAREHFALVVEDAAQGAGVRFGDRPAGAIGSLGVLSFGRGKGVTGGGGGALLANDGAGQSALEAVRDEVGEASAGFRQAVTTAAQWLLARPEVYAVPAGLPFLGLGETAYRPPQPIRRLPRFAGGVLARTWRLADAEAEIRRRHAGRLLAALDRAETPGRLAPARGAKGAVSGWLRLPLVAGSDRTRLLAGEATRLGVMPGYPRPLAELAGFAERVENRTDDFTGARLLADRLVTAPTHSRLVEGDLVRLEGWVAGM